MRYLKICMNCANEFETDNFFDNTLICSKCLSGDIHQSNILKYEDATLEDCFTEYFTNNIASIFDADNKQIILMEE